LQNLNIFLQSFKNLTKPKVAQKAEGFELDAIFEIEKCPMSMAHVGGGEGGGVG
jgi:hypothetical protein